MPLLATNRVTTDALELLSGMRRDRVQRERPAQLEERAAILARLAPPDQDALKLEAAHAAELDKAERALIDAKVALERTRDRAFELRRARHGRSLAAVERDQGARARLRALSHPAVSHVEYALRAAGFAVMAVVPSITGVEITETPIEPTAEEARRSWFRPFTRETRQPISTHSAQAEFLAAIGAARARVEQLQYEDITDDAVVTKLRAEVHALISTHLPMSLQHIPLNLSALRRKLDRSALELWTIDNEEDTR